MIKRIPNVSRFIGRLGFALVVLGVVFSSISSASPPKTGIPSGSYWIENTGQWGSDFQFKCEVGNAVYYVTPKGMTIDLREYHRYPKARDPLDRFDRDLDRDSVTVSGHVVQIHYVGAESKLAAGEGILSHYSNYFYGRDSSNWRSHVPHYQSVIAEQVWPGINVEYRADTKGVETIYHVSPGADPTQIHIDYIGLDAPLRIDAQGNLVLATSLGEVKEQAPYAYQMDGRTQKRIESTYYIIDNNRVVFEFEGFDASKELVVDPLLYGTYLGGGAVDECTVVAPGPDGGVYVAGYTYAMSGFPTTPGAYDETGQYYGIRNFVSRFGPEGEFIASTLFGEIQTESNPNTEGGVWDLACDSARAALWIGGLALHEGWPLTPDALDTTIDNLGDGFLVRLSDDLADLQYCSYLGGNSIDGVSALALTSDGRIWTAGWTYSTDFLVTDDALFSTRQGNDIFLSLIDPSQGEFAFSTYFGGSDVDYQPSEIVLDDSNILWLAARTYSEDIPVSNNAYQPILADSAEELGDVMIAGISLLPPEIEYCSYLGGRGPEEPYTFSISDSVVFVAGRTASLDFPVSDNAFDSTGPALVAPNYWDAFVARINWRTGDYRGTYLGGSAGDMIVKNSFRVEQESVTLLGGTGSVDFPVTANAFQTTLHGEWDGFVVQFTSDLSELRYGSYIGGTHVDNYNAAFVENADSLWVVGGTLSTDLPVTPNAIQPADNPLSSAFVQHFAIDTTADTTSTSHNTPYPTDFSLSIYPNPFNPITTLSFYVPRATEVKIVVHDVLGREVTSNLFGRLSIGQHEYHLDGSMWASGIYFVTLESNSIRTSVKLALVK